MPWSGAAFICALPTTTESTEKGSGMSQAKRTSLLLLLIFGTFILILAMSLPNLVLAPGQPFSLAQRQPEALQPGAKLMDGDWLIKVAQGFFAIVAILFVFSLLQSLLTRQGRKRLVVNFILVIILFSIMDLLHIRNENAPQAVQAVNASAIQMPSDASSATAVFSATPPPGLGVAISAGLALIAAILVAAGVWFMRRKKSPETALERLARNAQSAIESLQMGSSLKATVIRCYQEMSHVVQDERGIVRESTLTPREFEVQLIGKGLPQEPVQELTALFERVRYGNIPADSGEEALAIACLNAIVSACEGQSA